MDQVDSDLQRGGRGIEQPRPKADASPLAEIFDKIPDAVLIFRDNAASLSMLLMESAVLIEQLSNLVDPDDNQSLGDIFDLIDDLIDAHESMEAAIDRLTN